MHNALVFFIEDLRRSLYKDFVINYLERLFYFKKHASEYMMKT